MDHERVFHLVLITLGIPFVISATTSYIFDFIQHDGGQFAEDFLCSENDNDFVRMKARCTLLTQDYICLALKQKWWVTLREDQPLRL